MPPIPHLCYFCQKSFDEVNHRHTLVVIPEKDLEFLGLLYHKPVPKDRQGNRVCCRHFQSHDLVFKFTPKNYPGLIVIQDYERWVPSTRPPRAERIGYMPPPPKRPKINEKEENEKLRDRVKELEREITVLQAENEFLRKVAGPFLAVEGKEQQQRLIDEEKRQWIKENQAKPNLFTGIHVLIDSTKAKIDWFRTKSESLHEILWNELLTFLPLVPPNVLYTNDLLLQIFFFTFSTGLPIEAVARSVTVSGTNLSTTTISRWFELILSYLVTWAKKYVYFPTDKEWLEQSNRIHRDSAFDTYKKILFFFVDGSIIQVFDKSDPLGSRSLRNGKHGCPGWVFFIVVTPSGRIAYFSDEARVGSTHDKTHFGESGIIDQLTQKYPTGTTIIDNVEYQRVLGGDKAYPFAAKPEGWWWYITQSGEETKDVNENGEEIGVKAKDTTILNVKFDPGFARLRAVVERTIGRIKSWSIFSNRNHLRTQERVESLLWVAVGLVNWMFDHDVYIDL